MWDEIWTGLLHTLAYVGIGTGLLLLSYIIHDVLTPGKFGRLGQALVAERNVNAAIVTSARFGATALVIVGAIAGTDADFGRSVVMAAVYGIVGIALVAIVEFVLDLLTPGKLRNVVVGATFHPLSLLVATTNLFVGLIVMVSLLRV